MSKIGKNDIIRDIAKAHGQTQDTVRASVDAFLDAVRAHTEAGEAVQLQGFGIFVVKTSAARMGRNPQTGAPVEIAEQSRLTFKASKPRQG